ncbi:unnamed protein product [Rhizophagus irregularis]|nr:unnamed protein product [Rhizophagus irregularis]
MFLVGGFSESKYLQKRIKQKLNDLNNIGNDDNMKCVISSRVLKYTYGMKVIPKWEEGDPIHRKIYR